ncbi:hypothetical protein DMUE_4088 [Dictyocoela muelleri]|nr:hypothetical protein DMUE_4088 [Dictyocoela muelleri]
MIHCGASYSIFSNTILKNWKKGPDCFIQIIQLLFHTTRLRCIFEILHYEFKNLKKFISKLNKQFSKKYLQCIPKIGCPNVVAEIDECTFGKRNFNRGHHVEGIWVVGMVEITSERKLVLIRLRIEAERHYMNL